jgi:ubiquinol-cytochrome c reductase iron-sulfur subunit
VVNRDKGGPTRRALLYPVTAGVGLAALGLGGWSILRAAAPAAPTLPQLSVDLASIPEGSEIRLRFRGSGVIVRHRTEAEIAQAEADDGLEFFDPLARNANLDPATVAIDRNRRATPDGRFLVLSGGCPKFGCFVIGNNAGEFGGWFCPCCGGHFDVSGRIRRNPIPTNLAIPSLKVREGRILEVYAPDTWGTSEIGKAQPDV